ncbi:MAG: hypothetical protein BWK80_03535 [Desulfobacteraceae bacterium IS3]|nr:MAG: hypothetical protein BWK80_03535 [Desulfobacteraceae bacterium IS3]
MFFYRESTKETKLIKTKSIKWTMEKEESVMPELMIDIQIKQLAYMINNMSKEELETLYMFLTEEGAELLERNNDLKLKRVRYLTTEEVFDV